MKIDLRIPFVPKCIVDRYRKFWVVFSFQGRVNVYNLFKDNYVKIYLRFFDFAFHILIRLRLQYAINND